MDRSAQDQGAHDESKALRVVVVEDNDDLRDSLVELLEANGYAVTGFASAEEVTEAPEVEGLDLLIVDLNLPGEDGLSLASRLKRVQPRMLVIMMTTRTALIHRVRGYEAGADIYLPKPVDETEILAAVKAMGRRWRAESGRPAAESAGLVRLDELGARLGGPAGSAALTAVEVKLLSALARAPGQRLEHWQLLEVIGLDLDADNSRSNLAVRVTRLRNKLRQVGSPEGALKVRRGSGYQLCVSVEIT